ncbi:MAG: hypothetical protein P8169_12230 [Chloroflexota bacterium]
MTEAELQELAFTAADTERSIRECGQQQFKRVYEERDGTPWYLGKDGEWHEGFPPRIEDVDNP